MNETPRNKAGRRYLLQHERSIVEEDEINHVTLGLLLQAHKARRLPPPPMTRATGVASHLQHRKHPFCVPPLMRPQLWRGLMMKSRANPMSRLFLC